MAYRGERTTGRAYGEWEPQDQQDTSGGARGTDQRGADQRADAAQPSPPPPAPLWPPDERPERPIPPADPVGHVGATDALTEAETARIPIPTTISEAETARIPAPGALSEMDTARIPAPTARPSAGPLPTLPAAAFPGAPTSPSGFMAAGPVGPTEPHDVATPTAGRGLADLPTARIPTAGPLLTPVAPVPSPLPPVEPIWNAPTAPLAPHSRLTAPPTVGPAPRPTRPPRLEPTLEPASIRAARWGATDAPSWAAPARSAAPSTPLAPAPPLAPPAPMASAAPSAPPQSAAPASPPTRRPTGAPAAPTTPGMTPDAPLDALRAPRRTGGLALRLAVFALVGALLLAVVGVGVAYGYGVNQSGAPQRAISAYCAALRQANYTAAYDLLTPAAQARIPRQQYVSDGQARDAFYGRVSACQTHLLGADGRFIFWRQPTLVMYALTLQRGGIASAHSAPAAATGHIALTPDGASWRISAVDASLLGVDLVPLTVVSDFCRR